MSTALLKTCDNLIRDWNQSSCYLPSRVGNSSDLKETRVRYYVLVLANERSSLLHGWEIESRIDEDIPGGNAVTLFCQTGSQNNQLLTTTVWNESLEQRQ